MFLVSLLVLVDGIRCCVERYRFLVLRATGGFGFAVEGIQVVVIELWKVSLHDEIHITTDGALYRHTALDGDRV